MAHGYVAIIAAQHDLIALGDHPHIPIQTGVDGGLGAAGADGLDLGHRVGHLEQAAAALEEVAEEIGAQTEAENGDVAIVDDGTQVVDLRLSKELASFWLTSLCIIGSSFITSLELIQMYNFYG